MQVNSIWPTNVGIAQRSVDQCNDHKDIYNLIKRLEKDNSIDNGEGLGYVTD